MAASRMARYLFQIIRRSDWQPVRYGGRLAHKPLADGISPSQQTDINGPTAVINSVSRINVEEMEIGMVHNLKLMHGMLESDEGINQLINLLRTASMLGNGQMQFSYVDNEELKRAQASGGVSEFDDSCGRI